MTGTQLGAGQSVEERLARVEAQLEIIALEGRYAKTWDMADADGWASVFTPDGVFEIAAVGDRSALSCRGWSELSRFCAEFTQRYSGVHLPALPLIEIDGDTARGHLNFHFVAIGRLSGNHSMSRTASGHYEVRYRRTAEGWRMEHRLEKALASARSEFFDY